MMTPDQDLGFTLLPCQAGEILVTQVSATVNENASLVIDNILGLLQEARDDHVTPPSLILQKAFRVNGRSSTGCYARSHSHGRGAARRLGESAEPISRIRPQSTTALPARSRR